MTVVELPTTRLLVLLAVASALPVPVSADATLFIYPTLIVLEGAQRSAEITVANRGDQIGTFEMSWSDMAMGPDGHLVRQEGQAPWSLQPLIRYSPRRVTLAPAESQIIKIALRLDQEIPEGEYYSHLRVLTINSEDPLSADVASEAPSPAPGVSIQARTAVAIPVVWRNSRATPGATIEGVRIDPDAHSVSVDIRRHGLLSVRGYLHLLESPPDREGRALAEPVPAIIYPSLDMRAFTIPIDESVRVDELTEQAIVYYSPDLELTERSSIFAEHPLAP